VKLSLNLCDAADPPWLDEALVESIRQASKVIGPSRAAVNIVVADDPYIRELNRKYRKIDEPTDVISFSYLDGESPALEGEEELAGEVYISHQMVEKEAKEYGVETATMFMRIGVHGLLHIVGYDHVVDEDAERMEREEKSILSGYIDSAELNALF
jgi:probable rRNA maturation factor